MNYAKMITLLGKIKTLEERKKYLEERSPEDVETSHSLHALRSQITAASTFQQIEVDGSSISSVAVVKRFLWTLVYLPLILWT
jgi:hypothetical protein